MAHWIQLAASKRRFLIQSPDECALTLSRAFPEHGMPITGEAFAAQMRIDHPMLPEMAPAAQREGPDPPSI
jgi:hypothetical protein